MRGVDTGIFPTVTSGRHGEAVCFVGVTARKEHDEYREYLDR